jgi:hypothetical protein
MLSLSKHGVGFFNGLLAARARLSEYGPPKLLHPATASAHDPRRVAVFVHDLFDLLGFDAVPRNMLNVFVIPLRVQIREPHAAKLSR